MVGVRFKGNSSYNGATTKKKPFRIKLNEFVKSQKIDGTASFSLSNAWNDPSFVREKPYYELAAAAGLKAPRSNFAALYINDQYWGLYVLTEVVNGDFLKSFFGKGNDGGNLYKADIGASFSYLGEDPTPYKEYFEKQSNEVADDWTDLIELSKIIDQTSADQLPAKLEPLVDIDSVLTALALDNLTVNLDSYVSMGQNFYIYRRPSDKRWVWIPWDPSLAFGGLSQGLSTQQMKELALEYVTTGATFGGGFGAGGAGMPGDGGLPSGDTTAATQSARPLATKLWQVPQYKQRYREIYQHLVDSVLIPETLIARMNTLRNMIRPWVSMDTQKLVTMDQFEQAMTADSSSSAGSGGTPSFPTTPTNPDGGSTPPTGGVGQGGMGSAPGLQPFIEGRIIAVKALLAGKTPPTVAATPTSLLFAQAAGASAPATQTIALNFSDSSQTGTYTASSSHTWLTVSAPTGSLPASLTVTANGSALTVGTYTGAVTVKVAGATNSPLSIPVSLIVAKAPALVTSTSSLTFTAFASQGSSTNLPGNPGNPGNTATTQTFVVTSTSAAAKFTASIADATCSDFLSATPLTGTTPATISVSMKTTGLAAGTCTGTINLAAAGLASAAVKVTVTITSMPVPETASISAIVNGASYAAGAVAPGEIVTVYGSNFGTSTLVRGSFTNGKLATTLNGVQLTFDGVAAPLLYLQNGQLAAVVPFEVAGKTEPSVQISGRGQQSTALKQTVAAATPGIFTTNSSGSGQATAVNQTGTANGSGSPASRGSAVSVYLTGAGQLDPAGTSGAVATASAAQKIAATVTATIDGQPATVTYAGALPNSIQSMYRVDLLVPRAAASGNVPLLITIGGAATQAKVTLTVE